MGVIPGGEWVRSRLWNKIRWHRGRRRKRHQNGLSKFWINFFFLPLLYSFSSFSFTFSLFLRFITPPFNWPYHLVVLSSSQFVFEKPLRRVLYSIHLYFLYHKSVVSSPLGSIIYLLLILIFLKIFIRERSRYLVNL